MTRFTIVLFASSALVTGLGACSKKGGDAGAASAGKAAEATAGKAAAIKLDKLKLQLDVAGEPTVGDAILGDGVQLTGETIGAMGVEAMKEPKSLDDEKSDASMFTPKNLKADTLPDGWILTFENSGSMGTNYWVTARRDIAGKSYKCFTSGSRPEQAQAVAAACKTLRAM